MPCGLGLFEVVDESDSDLLSRSHVGQVRAEQGVEAETDGFAVKHIRAVRNSEFGAVGSGPGHADRVPAVERG